MASLNRRALARLRGVLQSHIDNGRIPGAIALYRSLDFVEEGRHVGYVLRNGAYVDALSMARLHPRPPVLAAAPG